LQNNPFACCRAARLTGALALLALAAPAQSLPATNTPARVVSATGQFVAYADTLLFAATLCGFAERVKHEWRKQLEAGSDWRDPIVIVLGPPTPGQTNMPAVTMQTFQTDLHLKYEIRCFAPPLDEMALLSALVEALCAETANRAQPTSRLAAYNAPIIPPWIVRGLAQSVLGRADLLAPVLRRSMAAGRLRPATELLAAAALPDDAAEVRMFEANAYLLTESLRQLPDGGRQLRQFLTELGKDKNAHTAFWKVYRESFPNEAALEKWWSLQLVRETLTHPPDRMTAEETGRELEQILRTRLVRTGNKAGQMEFDARLPELLPYYERPWLPPVLKEKSMQLAALRGTAHMSYENAIDNYIEAVGLLLEQKISRCRRALRRAEDASAAAARESKRIADFLDRAERARAPGRPAGFDEYFRTLEQLQDAEQQRRNPVSDYLDQLDR
jgi:hypothetical protein